MSERAEAIKLMAEERSLHELPRCTIVYSPGCAATLCALLRKATSSIHMTQAYFNHPAVIDEVWAADERGVQIKFLFDYSQCYRASACAGQKAIIAALAAKGATEEDYQEGSQTEAVVKLVDTPSRGVFHVKSWLLDERIYVGGSFNHCERRQQ